MAQGSKQGSGAPAVGSQALGTAGPLRGDGPRVECPCSPLGHLLSFRACGPAALDAWRRLETAFWPLPARSAAKGPRGGVGSSEAGPPESGAEGLGAAPPSARGWQGPAAQPQPAPFPPPAVVVGWAGGVGGCLEPAL